MQTDLIVRRGRRKAAEDLTAAAARRPAASQREYTLPVVRELPDPRRTP